MPSLVVVVVVVAAILIIRAIVVLLIVARVALTLYISPPSPNLIDIILNNMTFITIECRH